MKKIGFISFLMILMIPALGQDNWEEDVNELEDVQVEIVKDREIILPKASRSYEKVPPQPVVGNDEDLEYSFQNFNFEVPPLEFKLRPLKTKAEPLSKLYSGYLKAGFGNYVTPFAEGYFGNKRDKRYNYGIHLKHLSSAKGPIDEENSGVGVSSAELRGKIFGRKMALGSKVYYANRRNHYYGYDSSVSVDESDIRHDFNQLEVGISAESVDTPIDYELDFDYKYINDNYYLKENEIQVGIGASGELGREGLLRFKSKMSFLNQGDSSFDQHNRLLVEVIPQYSFDISDFAITAGVNFTYANDTLGQLSDFRIYPAIEAKYKLSKDVQVNLTFGGNTIENSYRELSIHNAFIGADQPLYFTNKTFDAGINLTATLVSKLTLNTGLVYSTFKNRLFFLNDTLNMDQFKIVYDTGNASQTNIFARLNYLAGEKVNISLTGDYFVYGMDVLSEAWHRPQYSVGLSGNFNIYKKLLLRTNLTLLGGIKAQNGIGEVITLDPVIDLGAQLEYLFSKRFSAFVEFNNILNQEYQLLNRYPVKGIQVLGGVSYSF